ncbi:MAG: GNAT family N-acetyltransferase [Pseudomonadota bacterium]
MTVDIRQADESDISSLYEFYQHIGKKDQGYFETVFGKDCVVLIAELPQDVIPRLDRGISSTNVKDPAVKPQDDAAVIVGFGILNFEPKYSFYQKLEIPEIQDVNVLPEFRQQGIATALIESFENLARDQGMEHIGISVGLTKKYGPAQRLYCKLGYIPDGNGITRDRESVFHDQMVHANDDLCLMLLKEL